MKDRRIAVFGNASTNHNLLYQKAPIRIPPAAVALNGRIVGLFLGWLIVLVTT